MSGPQETVAGPADILRLLWGEAAVVSATRSPFPRSGRHEFLLLPRPSRATFLVPARPRLVTEAALRDYGTANTRRARLLSGLGAPLGRLGLLGRALPRVTVADGPGEGGLMAHAEALLGQEVVPAIQLGPIRPNRKPVVQLRAHDGRPVAYMKVGITRLTRDRVAHEASALTQLQAHRESLTFDVPRLLHAGEVGAVNFAITSVVDTGGGVVLSAEGVDAAMANLATAFEVASHEIRSAPWWSTLLDELADLEGAEAEALRAAAEVFRSREGDRPLTEGAAHGDWAPWNMATPRGSAVVWDWERFRRGVPVGWDALHFEIERNRRAGHGALQSITHVIPDCGDVVRRNGAAAEDGRVILASYLLDLGVRQLRTRSEAAKDSRGSLTTWLLPALHQVLAANDPATPL
ncbi:hypothetical protein [uncultured Serinicoccus sp.]|uniref:hypothetical protein n=1 Tax=uncultured Serinicoccus sp. TaxID=735514 RepID=UPI002634DFDA|nr:hypothetical protein [uncultured Serinicoccus sp.]